MTHEFASDDDPNHERRRFLRGIAAAGVGLAAVPSASARSASRGAGEVTATDSLWYDGFEHRAVGDAELEVSDGSLRVRGASRGGVSVGVGEAESFGVRTGLDWEDEPGTARQFRGRGVLDGEPDRLVETLEVARTEEYDAHALLPDFRSVGADSYGLEVYDDGDLVHAGEGYSDPTFLTPPHPPRDVPVEIEIEYIWTGAGWMIVIRIVIDLPIVDPDDLEVRGDEIRLIPDEIDADLGPVTGVDVLGEDLDEFVIDGESVGVHGHDVRQIGDARLHPGEAGEFLGVEGLLESDGIAVGLDDPDGFGVDVEPFELREEGSAVETALRGTVEGRPNAPVGSASLTCQGDSAVLAADFSDIEAEGVHVAVFEDGEAVDEVRLPNGDLGITNGCCLVGWCGGPPVPWPWPWPDPFPLGVRVEESVAVEWADGTETVGDRFQFSPVGPGVEVEAFDAFELAGQGIDRLGTHGMRSY